MKYALATLLFLAVASLSEPWPQTDRKTWPIGTCTSDFCDCPAGVASRLCEDYEENESDCSLIKSYGTMNLLGELGYSVTGSPDCANAVSPLDGTYDLKSSHTSTTDSYDLWPANQLGTGDVCTSSEDCSARFLLRIDEDDGNAAIAPIVTMLTDAPATLCGASYRASVNQLRPDCAAGSVTGFVISEDTTYKVCAQYTQDDDCYLHIDPEGGTWCAGAIDSRSKDDCTGGAHQAVSYLGVADAADHATLQVDNVHFVAE